MTTIHPNNIRATNKTPEITRFVEFMNSNGLSYADIEASTDISRRTIATYVHKNTSIGGQLLRGLLENYSVSMDWIVSGNGSMYINEASSKINESSAKYQNEKPLIPHHELVDTDSMQDFWWLTAKATEQSLMQSGAKPNQDYNIIDLYKLAQPFVIERFKTNSIKVEVIGE